MKTGVMAEYFPAEPAASLIDRWECSVDMFIFLRLPESHEQRRLPGSRVATSRVAQVGGLFLPCQQSLLSFALVTRTLPPDLRLSLPTSLVWRLRSLVEVEWSLQGFGMPPPFTSPWTCSVLRIWLGRASFHEFDSSHPVTDLLGLCQSLVALLMVVA